MRTPHRTRSTVFLRAFSQPIAVLLIPLCLLIFAGIASAKTLQELQQDHADLRFGMFMHFNMNTFKPGWANSRVDPKLFNPTALDCNQWARTIKSAGMKYAVLTVKHHDGFILWPSKMTAPNGQPPYGIAQTSLAGRDVVKEYTDALRAQGLLPGLYFSIWDVANGVTGDWQKERAFVLGQLTELLTNYGKIPILAFDGWSWKMGHQKIPYEEIHALVKRLQPDCLILEHNGVHQDAWQSDVVYFEGGLPPVGNTLLACQGATIGGTWFWSPLTADITKIFSLSRILSMLTHDEAAYTNLLLDCPPNPQGLLDSSVVIRLKEVGLAWKPNLNRAPLPPQPDMIAVPINPDTAWASSGNAYLAIDGLNDRMVTTLNQTLWEPQGPLPQSLTLDLGSVRNNISMIRCMMRRAEPGVNLEGNVTGYRVSLSLNGSTYTEAAKGTWPLDPRVKFARFPSQPARYIRFEALEANGGKAVLADIEVGGEAMPTAVTGYSLKQRSRARATRSGAGYRLDGRGIPRRRTAESR